MTQILKLRTIISITYHLKDKREQKENLKVIYLL